MKAESHAFGFAGYGDVIALGITAPISNLIKTEAQRRIYWTKVSIKHESVGFAWTQSRENFKR